MNEEEPPEVSSYAASFKFAVQIKKFSDSLTMSQYGYRRLSEDYFSSNLIVQNFVIGDLTTHIYSIFFYDEPGQGKDANAVCRHRILYHLQKSNSEDLLLSMHDNCIGQNKSNTVKKFAAMLSLVFLNPGHSHMIADRFVAWIKKTIREHQMYHPCDFMDVCNTINSVKGYFIDHNYNTCHMFVG